MAYSSRSVIAFPLRHTEIQVEAASKRRSLWANGATKRAFDLTLAFSACLVTAPALSFIAVGVMMTSPGPVLFRQQRMGMSGKTFTILKFRTMTVQNGPLVTARNDARITRFGRVLRQMKLDELPQLFNVLRGDMSFVGPRPKVVEHQREPLICRPGLTGAATLAFIEEEKLLVNVPEEKLETYAVEVLHRIKSDVDKEYAMKSNLRTDLNLLFATALHLCKVRRSNHAKEMARRIQQTQHRDLSVREAPVLLQVNQ